jgi:hypothetical protein
MAFKRCARHLCCRVSVISMVVAEMNQIDLLNAEGGGLCIRPPVECLLRRVNFG